MRTISTTGRHLYDLSIACDYLPKMKLLVVLGDIDEGGQPKEPSYAFGPVIEKGYNLSGGGNLADKIEHKGHFALARYDTYFKAKFPTL